MNPIDINSKEWTDYREAEVQLFTNFIVNTDITYETRNNIYDQDVATLNASYGWTTEQVKDAFARSPKPIHENSNINRALNTRYEWNFYEVTGKWNN